MWKKDLKGWRKMDQDIEVADDLAINQKGLRARMNRLNTISTEYGTEINIKNTKILKISKGNCSQSTHWRKEIELVKEFCYVRSLVMKMRNATRKLKEGKETFSKRREQLKEKLSNNLKR